MAAVWLDLEAALAATIFHQLIYRIEAFTCLVADFLAFVATGKFNFADLTAVRNALMAENVPHQLLAAVAHSVHLLKTGRAIARMAPHRAWMPTRQLFLARAFTGGRRDTAFDRWVKLCDTTWAPQWLDRHETARFAESNMAEVGTFVQSAGKLLIALNHAKVASIGIGTTFLDRAANLLALMLLALLELIANALAL